MKYADIKSRLPAYVKGGDRPEIARELATAYDRPFAFLRGGREIAPIAEQLHLAALKYDASGHVLYPYKRPAKSLIGKVARADDASKLKSVLQVLHLCQRVLEESERPRLRAQAEYLQEVFKDTAFPNGHAVLALHVVNMSSPKGTDDPYPIEVFRRALVDAGAEQFLDLGIFSAALFDRPEGEAASPVPRSVRTQVLHHLTRGYETSNDGGGTYRATETLATEIHKGCSRLGHTYGVASPPMMDDANPIKTRSALFKYGADAGVRAGHSSRALPPGLGNVID